MSSESKKVTMTSESKKADAKRASLSRSFGSLNIVSNHSNQSMDESLHIMGVSGHGGLTRVSSHSNQTMDESLHILDGCGHVGLKRVSSHSNQTLDESLHILDGSGHAGLDDFNNISQISGFNDSIDMSQISSFIDSMNASFYGDSFHTSEELTMHVESGTVPTAEAAKEEQTHRMSFEDISIQANSANPDDENYEMEISPGVYLPFRGSKETWNAVKEDNSLETTCLECGMQLVSVPDCQCVICPDCKVINPIFEHPPGTKAYGVGMGLQKDLIRRR